MFPRNVCMASLSSPATPPQPYVTVWTTACRRRNCPVAMTAHTFVENPKSTNYEQRDEHSPAEMRLTFPHHRP